MRVVPLEAFRDKVPYSVAIAAVERGFRALGRGEAALPDPMVLELREQQAEVHVKGAHLAGGRHIVLKVATGFYGGRGGPDPQVSGTQGHARGPAGGRGRARPVDGAGHARADAARAPHAVES